MSIILHGDPSNEYLYAFVTGNRQKIDRYVKDMLSQFCWRVGSAHSDKNSVDAVFLEVSEIETFLAECKEEGRDCLIIHFSEEHRLSKPQFCDLCVNTADFESRFLHTFISFFSMFELAALKPITLRTCACGMPLSNVYTDHTLDSSSKCFCQNCGSTYYV